MAEKKSFVLYCDYRKHFSLLPPEERGHLIMAIFDYVETGVEPILDGMTMMAFSFIRAQLDRDIDKYRETCRRRAEAGVKSGEARRAKAQSTEQPGTKRTNVQFVQQNEQPGTKRTDNDTDNENENDNVNDNDNGNVNDNVPYQPWTASKQPSNNPFLDILMDERT